MATVSTLEHRTVVSLSQISSSCPLASPSSQLAGYGMSGDAHHATQPPPDGRGARQAMLRALRSAGCDPDEVGYVNAHATSTPQGAPRERG